MNNPRKMMIKIVAGDSIEETHKELGEISTEEYNSEDLDSVRSKSEEHEANVRVRRRLKTPKLPQYRRESDKINPTLHLGLEFPNMKQ
ncbi:hypothetical protein PS2_018617 [Malus domestica]